ncbi:MAG: membrane dipeptidase [Gemmataceae bacterium]|nr:membrane dipeptidase [Gemmataceae bacterium]
MIVFDAHLDLAWNAIDWNRDIRLPADKIRQIEKDAGMTDKGRCCNTVSFPELRRGKVVIFIATLLARLLRIGAMPAIQRYSSMVGAYGAAYGQLHYYRGLEQEGLLRRITDGQGLEAHVQDWRKDEESTTLPLGYILSMEGADPVLRPDQVQEWFDAGLRIIGPTHYGVSPYGHGTGTEGGLFPEGKELLREMERVGMILDVTHLSDQCFDEALEIYGGPILASHHNNRTLVPNQRQLTDEQTKRLITRGAVIGHALDTWMMIPNWVRGETKTHVPLERICAHIDRVCQMAGNARHAAIGTDLDGGFGREQSPGDLDTIADLQRLPDMLRKRGYTETDIEGIMYANWVRFFKEAW